MKPRGELCGLVDEELRGDPRLRGARLGMLCDDGVVTLTGAVGSLAVKEAAARAANRVHAVRAVVNEIIVEPGPALVRADQEIAKAVLLALQWDFEVPHESLRVRVEHGWVFLEGEVTWNYERIAAESAVQHLTGVRGITNGIVIRSSPGTASQIANAVGQAIRRMAGADAADVSVAVEHGKAFLRGTVRRQATRDHAPYAAWNTRGITAVVNEIRVSGAVPGGSPTRRPDRAGPNPFATTVP